ncbi:hypothetical protein DZA28_22510 [Pseudomonas alloputida]|uniref:Uncharacterized protein n=3 Tax=Pseudomonas TaxID=286 RepID=A0ABD6N348_9PSED|nr:hypothetical protein [Pseudomonas hunanensis]TRZ62559.1 hypothetical protein DZA28_22510 [Pseudomonas alloputida]
MITVGAGMPAKQAAQWMARASPVFAGMPAPTVIVQNFNARAKQLSRHKKADRVWVETYAKKTPLISAAFLSTSMP